MKPNATLRKRLLVIAGALVALNVAMQGCAFDDTTEAAHPYNGLDATVDGTSDDGGGGQETSILGLCVKVGGAAEVTKIATDTNAKLAADCRIGGYFATLSSDSMTHMNDCFSTYLGATFDCAGVSYLGSKDSKGQDCRSMANAHQGLGISSDDFTAFREDIVSVMKAHNMATSDVNSVLSLLTGVAGVYSPNKKGNYECTCPNDAGCVYAPQMDAGRDAEGGTEAGTEAGPMDSGGGTDTGGGTDAGADGD
jgi:hypothetical protein